MHPSIRRPIPTQMPLQDSHWSNSQDIKFPALKPNQTQPSSNQGIPSQCHPYQITISFPHNWKPTIHNLAGRQFLFTENSGFSLDFLSFGVTCVDGARYTGFLKSNDHYFANFTWKDKIVGNLLKCTLYFLEMRISFFEPEIVFSQSLFSL